MKVVANIVKVIFALVLVVVLVGLVIYPATVKDNNGDDWQKKRMAAVNLYADNYEYKDYANDVFFDTNTYPELKEQGLFWVEWDENSKTQKQYDADTELGASKIDPSKPIFIIIHGMMSNGHLSGDDFYLNSNIAIPTEFGLPSSYTGVSLARLWQLKGWNVGYYRYEKFTSQPVSIDVKGIESKIWSLGMDESGVFYRRPDGSVAANVTNHSLAEHFAADYLRAFSRLSDEVKNNEIRLSAHSMGGELSTAGMFLLTELAAVGQIDFKKIPSRFALLDPYFSITMDIDGEYKYVGASGIRLSWSNRPLYKNNVSFTMIECLKDLDANGIAVEYYAYESSFLRIAMVPVISELQKYCVYVLGNPDYHSYSSAYNILYDGHNAIRDYYMCSIAFEPVVDIYGKIAASASTPTSSILALKGNAYLISSGEKTIRSSDDIFAFMK